MSLLSSIEALMEIDGRLPVNVKFILDGAEESGSRNMQAFLACSDVKAWVREADYGFNVDAMMHSDNQGLLWRGLRGAGDVEVTVTSANTDVHSGIFGGSAPNAIHAASRIIASMFNDDGSVAISGFQAGLIQPTQALREEIKAVEPDLAVTLDKEKLGIAQWIGDPNYTALERTWIRNSLDATRITGGYAEGKASIVASKAWFRLMYRTGPGEDPKRIDELIRAHVKQHAPWGVRVDMTSFIGPGAVYVDANDPAFKIAFAVLTDALGQAPKVTLNGASVSAISHIYESGGPKLVSFGFQRSDEGFHAANEFMRVDSFKKGQRAYLRLLHALVGQPKRK